LPDIVSDPTRASKVIRVVLYAPDEDEVSFSFNKDGGNNLTMLKQRRRKVETIGFITRKWGERSI